ncbi:MAG: PilW family protein [Candidatus Sumerlaeota bacterium]
MLSGKKRAFTLVEIGLALSVSTVVSIAIIGIVMMSSHLHKSIFHQQIALKDAKRAIEMMNRELRLAESPLNLVDADGDNWGNAVEFSRPGETTVRRIELLPGDDDDQTTPWDNVLVYYEDVDDEDGATLQIAPHLAFTDEKGAFHYVGSHTPLTVNLRVGDTVEDPDMANTGKYFQGAEIHITISPRN